MVNGFEAVGILHCHRILNDVIEMIPLFLDRSHHQTVYPWRGGHLSGQPSWLYEVDLDSLAHELKLVANAIEKVRLDESRPGLQ